MPIRKLRLDLWLYQELIFSDPPPFIIETRVACGGPILHFAHLLDAVGAPPDAIIVGIYLELPRHDRLISHRRVRLVEGNSSAPDTIRRLADLLPAPQGMVILDSDHSYEHVTAELAVYSPLVKPGCYLVVEDTNLNGHPVLGEFGPGPFEAVDHFLKTNSDFARDDDLWRRNLFSFHQYGWLKRLK